MKQNKKGKIKNNFLGQKKELPPEEKKEKIKIIDKKPEVPPEEEKIEKIPFLNHILLYHLQRFAKNIKLMIR